LTLYKATAASEFETAYLHVTFCHTQDLLHLILDVIPTAGHSLLGSNKGIPGKIKCPGVGVVVVAVDLVDVEDLVVHPIYHPWG
jgi:hypothetical protein